MLPPLPHPITSLLETFNTFSEREVKMERVKRELKKLAAHNQDGPRSKLGTY